MKFLLFKKKKLLFYLVTLLFFLGIFYGVYFLNNEYQIERKRSDRLFNQILHKNLQFNKLKKNLDKKNLNIENILTEGKLVFRKNSEKKLDDNLYLTSFVTRDLLFNKHYDAIASSYIEYDDQKIFLTTGTGLFAYGNLINDKKVHKFKIIPSNIMDIVKYDEFYVNSQFGIKDTLILKKHLYISFIDEIKKDCFTLSIFRSELNIKSLNFKRFFSPQKCLKNINAHQGGGGRMVSYGNEKILFTIGEFRQRSLSQQDDNLYGKIFSIDINTKKTKILSKGHRNVQGLYFDNDKNLIISTEMGPKGGDEININDLSKESIKNFGWPISSYGVHYSKETIKGAPLYKSHKKYGFIEPIKQFTPSIAPSEITKINRNSFIMGSMGRNIDHGSLSIIYIELDEDSKKIVKSKKYFINERVRDIKNLKEKKILLMYFETSSSIGILRYN